MTAGLRLLDNLTRNWWLLLLRGLLAIAFALVTWFMPGLSITVFVLLFGAFVFVDGVLGIWGAVTGPKGTQDRWVLVLWGIAGLAAGAVAFLAPGLVATSFIFLIAAWAVLTGILEIVAALRLRKQIEGEWMLIVAGLVSVAFGVLLALRPGAGAVAVSWLIGGYAFLLGLLLVFLSFKVRSAHKRIGEARGGG
ncbi:MAG: HdeD family acid-resistance protein [Gemmatimonadota bacterium]